MQNLKSMKGKKLNASKINVQLKFNWVKAFGISLTGLFFVLGLINPLAPAEAGTRPATFLAEAMMIQMADDDETEIEKAHRTEMLAQFLVNQYKKTNIVQMRKIVEEAYNAGEKFDVDPLLILAIIGVESSFNPKAVSRAGAHGLMQIMVKVHKKSFAPFGGVSASKSVRPNIEVGTKIFADYLDKTGSVYKALKHYAGAANLKHDRGYGSKVMHLRTGLVKAANGRFDVARNHLKSRSHEDIAMSYFYDQPKKKETSDTTG